MTATKKVLRDGKRLLRVRWNALREEMLMLPPRLLRRLERGRRARRARPLHVAAVALLCVAQLDVDAVRVQLQRLALDGKAARLGNPLSELAAGSALAQSQLLFGDSSGGAGSDANGSLR